MNEQVKVRGGGEGRRKRRLIFHLQLLATQEVNKVTVDLSTTTG